MTTRKIVTALCMTLAVLVVFASVAAAQMPTSTTEKTKGEAAVTTQELKGEVMFVQGNDLVVKLAGGELKTFRVPESRQFIIDGKTLTVRELQVGTKLTAKVTTTNTPVTVRTTTVGSGKVWFVSGNTVIVTLPNGENRQYVVTPDMKFTVDGNPATVRDLRQGMNVAAEKIVEEPQLEVAVDTKIVGHAPGAPAAAPAAAPAMASNAGEPAPAKLPKTASPLPLVGLLGLLSLGASLGLRRFSRS